MSQHPIYLCPLCSAPLKLSPSANGYFCTNNHHFDLAKEGYLNLLPVQFKHSAQPGDNKPMVQARREFLEAGHYGTMAKAVATVISSCPVSCLLDLGCGEGYYTREIEAQCPHKMVLHGVDIAKFAIAAAAKKQPHARFIVASSNRLPYPDHCFDFVLRIFAPSKGDELKRIVKPSGLLLTVTPGPRHLWQLKEFIYSDVQEHPLEGALPLGFESIESQRISYPISPTPQQRLALLQMTPFAWRASETVRQAIKDAGELEIETDFILTLARPGCLVAGTD